MRFIFEEGMSKAKLKVFYHQDQNQKRYQK